MYTVVNSLFSNDNNNYPQKTPNVNLIYIIDDEVLNKCCVKKSEKDKIKFRDSKKKCEENIKSFLSYIAEKFGAKSVVNMDTKKFTELVCDLIKSFKKEENNNLCDKVDSLIEPYDLSDIMMYEGYLYIEDSYKIEKAMRIPDILDILKNPKYSVILSTRVGKSISVTYLIRLRVKLSIEDTILFINKIGYNGRKEEHTYKRELVNYKCDLDLAIFISQ